MIIQLIFLSLITLLITSILIHPTVCVAGAASGLSIWFNSALPSLFPFMALTGLIIRMNILETLSRQLARSRLFRRVPLSFLFAAITGLLCGYPMGIRTVSDLQTSGQLSRKQARLLLSFVNQPGPMFILGYALPLCGMTDAGTGRFLMAFYGGVVCTALIAILGTWIVHVIRSAKKAAPPIKPDALNHRPSPKQESFFQVFEETIISSMVTLTKIGGYMMLFSLLFALMEKCFSLSSDTLAVLGGLLEMTSGIAKAAALGSDRTPYFILGFLSFGGLCVTAQSLSLGKLETGEQLYYLFCKALQAVLAMTLFYLINTYLPV